MKPLIHNTYPLILILVASSVFRLLFLDLMEFKTDQSYMVYKMAQFWESPEFYLVASKNSAGAHNFPLIYYVFSLLTAPSRNPLVLAFIIAAINVLSIVFFYLFVRKYYGNFVAVASSLLLSLSPWAILYSRQIWTLDLVVPLTVPFYYFLHKLILDKDKRAVWGVALFGLLLAQWHASGIFLLAATVLVLVVGRTKFNFRHLSLGTFFATIPAIPFFFHQIQSTPIFPDLVAYLRTTEESARGFTHIFFTQPFQMINALSMREFVINDWENFTASFPLVATVNIISLLLFPLLLVGIFYVASERKRLLFLVFVPFIVALLLTASRANPFGYYELTIVIPIMIIFGVAFEALNKFTKVQVTGPIILMIILLSNVVFEISFYKFLDERVYVYGQYGPIYRYTDRLTPIELSGLERARAMFDHHNDLNPEFKEVYQD